MDDPPASYGVDDEAAAFATFRRRHPAYESTARLDRLRETEYARLERERHVYLDYTGGSLYAESQLRNHADLLGGRVFGNPHSTNPTSSAMTSLVEQARRAVLRFFNASPDEYSVIFTPNATGAIKLVAEAYPFGAEGRLLLTADNHNSVNGIREFAHSAGAATTYVPGVAPDLRVDELAIRRNLQHAGGGANLFAYPAQSNFSGVQHPLEWIAEAQAAGWDVLLDCAAYAPTNRLDLGRWHPDFVPISFYKLFGYPTGVGCLLVRKEARTRLRRPWFAGGTILAVSAAGGWHRLADDESAFEDGTLNYLALPAVEYGLRHLDDVGIDIVHTRVQCLTAWLLHELGSLRHGGGAPVVEIYGPQTTEARGATIALNFVRPDGRWVDEREVDRVAAAQRISLRTGCFCNPGAGETAFGIAPPAVLAAANDGAAWSLDEYVTALGLQSGGAVRVSLGIATTFTDVHTFMRFAAGFRDAAAEDSQLAPRLRC